MGKILIHRCQHCQAPVYSESPWFAIIPPPEEWTCEHGPKQGFIATHTSADIIIQNKNPEAVDESMILDSPVPHKRRFNLFRWIIEDFKRTHNGRMNRPPWR